MTVKKLDDGRYEVDCRPEGRNGPRIRKKFRTKNEAMVYERQILGNGAHGVFEKKTKADERRLSELVELWFSLHGQGLKSGTSVRRELRNMVLRMGNPLVCNFTADTFANYRSDRLSGKCRKPGSKKGPVFLKPVSIITTNHELTHLTAMFNELERLGKWDKANPLQKVRALKYDQTEMSYLSGEQITLLLAHLDQIPSEVGLIARVCLATGARWAEAMKLGPELVKDRRIYFVRTKSAKNRTVPITEELSRMLENRLPWKATYRQAYYAFRDVVRETGIELPKGQLTHVLRHSFASHYMMNGGDILTLQQVLGHSSLMMTMRYAHFSPGHLAEVVSLNPLAKGCGHFVDDSRWLKGREEVVELAEAG
ncbi:phage integrase [Pseudomonas koreensis]|uniref:phage integrase n=1 Tax=Pseudomonas koreensis TaxID=198620 RepID=UPI001B3226D1|nr:tyrosine-type recombinase/integrase [Pseudomonas koreensis]MBP4002472.1 tyrosine-type recombinase/integrase [Pseudomonas koreensis]